MSFNSKSLSFSSSPLKKPQKKSSSSKASSRSHSSSSKSSSSKSRSRSRSRKNPRKQYSRPPNRRTKIPYSDYLKIRLEKRRSLPTPLIWEFTSDEEEYEKDKLVVEELRNKEYAELKAKYENGVQDLLFEDNNIYEELSDTSVIPENEQKKLNVKDKTEKQKMKKNKKSKKKSKKHKKKKIQKDISSSSNENSESEDSSASDTVEDEYDDTNVEDPSNGEEKNKENNEKIEHFVGPLPLQIDSKFNLVNYFQQ